MSFAISHCQKLRKSLFFYTYQYSDIGIFVQFYHTLHDKSLDSSVVFLTNLEGNFDLGYFVRLIINLKRKF